MAGRGVLLVGASSLIGQATADRFAADGDTVVGASIQPFDYPGLRAHVEANCATENGAQHALDTILDIQGRLDVIVLAAAVQPTAPITEMTPDQWTRTFDAILTSAYHVCRLGIPLLRPGSAIVAISSVNGRVVVPGLPSYSAAKAGLEGLIRQLALEYGPRGIRANTVVPGTTTNNHSDPSIIEGYPLRRVGFPHEIAAAVHFLAGPDASFITGVSLPVDGGLSISSPGAFARPELRARFIHD